ncbi:energy-coupling factor ABC transporter ATP-binding protein, partial [Halorubrum ezzemoulense]|uniref:ATP-binding cassette domain-containing protein n=1 Tax=Halorubrum ezzemoulense TaxID=337243 RepID=UPI00232B5A2C
MGPVIEARGLTHEYPDGTTALRDVTVTIEAGKRVAVIGANGSGKSTLQHVLGGLVEPTAGTVEYVGETADAEAVRDRLGVLLQDPDDYLFNTTVREDIEYGPAQLGMSRQAATQ